MRSITKEFEAVYEYMVVLEKQKASIKARMEIAKKKGDGELYDLLEVFLMTTHVKLKSLVSLHDLEKKIVKDILENKYIAEEFPEFKNRCPFCGQKFDLSGCVQGIGEKTE